MRPSRVPPSGFTRALPQPPRARRAAYLSGVCAGLAALAVAVTFLTPGAPARRDTPAAEPRPAPSAAPPPVRPAPDDIVPADPEREPDRTAARPRATVAAPPAARRRPEPRRTPVAAPRPAPTSAWARTECARRFSGDPRRRSICEKALAGFPRP
ncbi:hypothetical protein [Spirillospora sp. CA-294931]|uniref:hypothetical protein n=1 Tax=Spirillospora sp. CA-294931 TaxID=3240042 RepID=UPI003D8A7DC1